MISTDINPHMASRPYNAGQSASRGLKVNRLMVNIELLANVPRGVKTDILEEKYAFEEKNRSNEPKFKIFLAFQARI